MKKRIQTLQITKIGFAFVVLGGALLVLASPFLSEQLFANVWGVEPLTYVGVVLFVLGLAGISASYAFMDMLNEPQYSSGEENKSDSDWTTITGQYFDLFDHDLGRPLRRILGKQREVRENLKGSQETKISDDVLDLMDEIERQAPNFRLMLANIRILVQLESPSEKVEFQPVEPVQIVQKIVDRYMHVAHDSKKQISWWADPSEFGLVYSDSSAIEHIVTNLVDNAMRFCTSEIEVRITKNPTHFFIRIWDDGGGIPSQYMQHLFDRGWTPEATRREEKISSGLGLFIARTLARKYGGDLTAESLTEPNDDHHTAFLLSLPLAGD